MLNKHMDKSVWYFLLSMFFLFVTLALIIPFNRAPDEADRFLLSQYMYNHNALPNGLDSNVRIANWGSSYAFSPFLSYMIGAFFMKIMSLFSTDFNYLLFASRFSNVLISTFSVYFIIKIADHLFENGIKWLFIILCTTLPCFVFVSSYVNSDALAILSSAIIIYSWILGVKSHWDKKSCIYLVLGLSLCVLSYLNAYGYLFLTVLLYVCEMYKLKEKKERVILLKKGSIVFVAVAILGGWFYLRNYILYDGDFLGFETNAALSEKYGIDELKPSNKFTVAKSGKGLIYMLVDMKWLEDSYHSFIGVFGYMNLYLPKFYYNFYNMIFIIGMVGCVYKHKRCSNTDIVFLKLLLFLSIIIPIVLSLYYSYFNDFQSQGRYLLPALIPMMYYITTGIQNVLVNVNYKNNNLIINSILMIFLYMTLYMIVHVFGATYVF